MSSYLNKQAPPPPPPKAAGPPPSTSSSTPSDSLSPSARTKPTARHKHTQSHHYNDAPDLAALTGTESGGGGISRSRSKTANRASRVPALGSIPSPPNDVENDKQQDVLLPASFNISSTISSSSSSSPPPPPLPISSIRTGPRSLPYDVTHFPPPSLKVKTIVIFIPGNPGLISYYQEFLSNLQDSLPNEEVKESLEIYSIGHLGHCLQTQEGGRGFKPKDQASLQEQVESKIEFLDELKEKYNIQHHQDDDDEQVKIIVMGHSIGSWICLQMMKARPKLISSAHLLFPTISSMAQTRNGRKLSPLFSSWSLRPLYFSTSFLSYLPTSLVSTLVSILTGQSRQSGQQSESGLNVTSQLVSNPQTVIASITMAQKEMEFVKELDRDLLMKFGKKIWWYWAERDKDGWVLEESIEEIENVLGSLGDSEEMLSRRRERCKEGMPHAFVLNSDHTRSLAKKCAGWIVKDLS